MVRKGSMSRVLGWSAGAVAAAAFVATGAYAEGPSHQVTRPVRVSVQRPHAPHAVHKPHPAYNTQIEDHPAQVVHNIAPGVSTSVVHVHKNVHVQPIVHVRPPRKTHTVTIVQMDHVKSIKKVTK